MTESPAAHRVQVVDSHTAGEPTRVVIAGGPDLGDADIAARARVFRELHDGFRAGIVQEPRGSEVVVGALLCQPQDPANTAAVIFFNDVGTLGMCGHGTIGLVTTLAHLGRIRPGRHSIETPVGVVQAQLHADGEVSVENVASYRYRDTVAVEVPGHGVVTGDIAWGGNWFFLVAGHGYRLHLEVRAELVAFCRAVRSALAASGITGVEEAVIDHIELTGPAHAAENSGRNFVLCPGSSFDRSPCGTGTSAKLACLHASGALAPGDIWRQEGILGTVFTGSIRSGPIKPNGNAVLPPTVVPTAVVPIAVIPTIRGRAWITGESTLLFDAADPFREGIAFG